MADYQVLPPGLNQMCYKANTVDPKIFQINGEGTPLYFMLLASLSLCVCVCVEPYDKTFDSGKVPLFLPPWTFSKFDKPSNYA